jgi:hypothetical protein
MSRTAFAATATRSADEPFFLTRGVVITTEDLTLADWPERAVAAGLTTVGLHAPKSPRLLARYTPQLHKTLPVLIENRCHAVRL